MKLIVKLGTPQTFENAKLTDGEENGVFEMRREPLISNAPTASFLKVSFDAKGDPQWVGQLACTSRHWDVDMFLYEITHDDVLIDIHTPIRVEYSGFVPIGYTKGEDFTIVLRHGRIIDNSYYQLLKTTL